MMLTIISCYFLPTLVISQFLTLAVSTCQFLNSQLGLRYASLTALLSFLFFSSSIYLNHFFLYKRSMIPVFSTIHRLPINGFIWRHFWRRTLLHIWQDGFLRGVLICHNQQKHASFYSEKSLCSTDSSKTCQKIGILRSICSWETKLP